MKENATMSFSVDHQSLTTSIFLSSSKSSTNNTSTELNNDSDDQDLSITETVEEYSTQSINDYEESTDSSEASDSSDDSSINCSSSTEESFESSSEGESEYEDQEKHSLPSRNAGNQRQATPVTINELIANPDSLPLVLLRLLQRVRALIGFIRQSSVLDRYIRRQIRAKRIEIRNREEGQNTPSLEPKQLILDFSVRWNTTYTMLTRFIAMGSIITEITLSPSVEIGLKKKQYAKLRNLSFTGVEWSCLTALTNVLLPFYRATKLLSGYKYPTLSMAHSVTKALKNALASTKQDQPIENLLKERLLVQFNHYFEEEMTEEQKRTTLVSLNVPRRERSKNPFCTSLHLFRFNRI